MAKSKPRFNLSSSSAITLISKNKYSNAPTNLENDLMRSCQSLLNYLPLLFIPVGVGVVMHLSLLEENLISVISIIILGTLLTLALTGFIMEKLLKENDQK